MKLEDFKRKCKIMSESEVVIKLLSDRIKKLEYENFILKKENTKLFKILNEFRKERTDV